MIRIFLVTILLSTSIQAISPLPYYLRQANGSALDAKPVGLSGERIVFLNPEGKKNTAAFGYFSEAEQKKLKAWSEVIKSDHHYRVIKKMKATKQPKILFIGNSYNFEVPKALEKLAISKNKRLTVEQVTKGGFTLLRHSNSAKLIAKIHQGSYDIVILQEQSLIPSFPENLRAKMMDKAVKTLIHTIKESGAEPIFFQTWGRRDGDKQNAKIYPGDTFESMQKRLNHGYANAAKASGGAHIFPIGKLWGLVMKKDKPRALTFYQKDGSHPSKAGVDFAVAVIYSSLYDEASGENISQEAKFKAPPYPLK